MYKTSIIVQKHFLDHAEDCNCMLLFIKTFSNEIDKISKGVDRGVIFSKSKLILTQ